MLGHSDAFDVWNLLNPVSHGMTHALEAKYKVEPYVIAADVYTNSQQLGRGGWSWYTGAAGWFFQALIIHILGMNINRGILTFKPCVPAGWEGFEIDYRYGETNYLIKAHRENGEAMLFDGTPAEGVRLIDDGRMHTVEVGSTSV